MAIITYSEYYAIYKYHYKRIINLDNDPLEGTYIKSAIPRVSKDLVPLVVEILRGMGRFYGRPLVINT